MMGMDEELALVGLSFEQWWAIRNSEKRQFVEIEDVEVERLRSTFPGFVSRTLVAADRVCEHEFDLLGSGPYRPIDLARAGRFHGYTPIDWAYDPIRRVSFPNSVPHKKWNLYEMRPANADIKFPWELARCQQFAPLGQAWRLTGDSRYAIEIINQMIDFSEANPIGIGVNWTCTMDVALRACNWSLGLAMIKNCSHIGISRFRDAYAVLFNHGRFIFENFENTWGVTTNHYLSNLTGLHFLAAEFRDLKSGCLWDECCRRSLEQEIDKQVLADGADFESSIPYHRLVTELFLGSYVLAQHQRNPLSSNYADRLHSMVDYLVGVLRPDGLMPQIGDADDGRLCVFTDWGCWRRQDPRHILGPASKALDRSDLLPIGGDSALWESAWWGFMHSDAAEATSQTLSDNIRLYPDSGIFVARRSGDYLLVTNSKVGTNGLGNHKHNDQLSFELHLAGIPLIVDPGSYVYTSDFKGRNHFRSTAAHSTLQVDGVGQNNVNPENLFRMFEMANAEHVACSATQTSAHYAGRHFGYRRLKQPVTHEREFRFNMLAGILEIEDRLDGVGVHDLSWTFQLAPGIAAQRRGHNIIVLRSGKSGDVASISWATTLTLVADMAAYSPSYGTLQRAVRLRFTKRADMASENNFRFIVQHIGRSGMPGKA